MLKKIQKPCVWAVALALVSVALVPMSRPAVAQQYFYTVQVGDTLSGISQLYGASVEAVADANGISNPDLIITGQLLSIPGASSVSEPESAWEPDPVSSGAGGGQPSYTVQAGDNLGAIADLFGVAVSELAEYNGISDPNVLVTGQTLAVPGGFGTATPQVVDSSYLDYDDLRAMFHDAARIHGEDPYLMMALAWQESGWQQDVVSYAGAYGIMQVMPDTADWAGPALVGWETDYVNSAWGNIQTGVAFFAHLYSLSGSDYYALAGYYQGPYSVETQGLFSDTEAYVWNILEMRDLFASGRMP
ncbi:MAG: LysM peptidoglycan-binding domain-containing protein [Chloroflexia bacterium]|nr:LysM peptidoglycan-binding domain-containing protein [Chloroflexia bacterium]